MNKNEKIIDIDSSGGLQMIMALTLVDIFQRNLFYFKINTNCSSDYESLGLVGLLWEFFFVSLGSAGIPWVLGLLLVLMLPFTGSFWGCLGCASVQVCVGLWRLVVWVAKVLKQTFVIMIKSFIGTGGVILSLFRPVVYGLISFYACIRKTPKINIR